MIYTFENYSLDSDRRELRCGKNLVAVEPQVFDLIQYLIRNRERVVSKDDLIAGVWHGRVVSESTLSSRITAVRHALRDSGEQQRLIRTVPRKGLRFVGEITEEEASGNAASTKLAASMGYEEGRRAPALTLPDKPSIAVLPFQNMSGDPEQEYFADGMVEDIIAALSRIRWLFVIARNSSFTYKGREVNVNQVGRELGVRYVLEGSVRKAGSQVRIGGRLIDVSTGAYLWADRIDGAFEDIFNLQDQVTTSVVAAIAPKLELAEIERAKRKPTESLDAYDYFLRATANFHQGTKDSVNEALRLFYKAIELDPDFAAAYGMAAWCFVRRKVNAWMADRARETAEASRLARRAVELGKNDAVALCSAGNALAVVARDLDAGADALERALLLNPNLSAAWAISGWLKMYIGEPEVAIEHLTRALRLSPLDPFIYMIQAGFAFAHFFAGRYDEASSWAERAIRQQPNFLPATRIFAASCAYLSRLEDAKRAMDRLRHFNPTQPVFDPRRPLPFRRTQDVARYQEGMRKAELTK